MKTCNRGIVLVVLLLASCSTGEDAAAPPERETSQQTLTSDGMVTLPATGWGDPGVTTSTVPAGWAAGSVAWCCTNWWVPIPVAAGDVVGSVAALVKDVPPDPLYIPGSQGDGGSSVTLSLVAQNGTTQTVLRSIGSNGSGNHQSLIMTLTSPYTVPAGTTLLLKATAFALWPSQVMHPSIVGPVSAAAPTSIAAVRTRPISGLTAVPEWPASGVGATRVANTWSFVSSRYMYFPVPVTAGELISGYQVYVNKNSNSSFAVMADFVKVNSVTGQQTVVAGASNSTAAPGNVAVGSSTPIITVTAGFSYLIRVSGNSTADSFTDASINLN